MATRIGSG